MVGSASLKKVLKTCNGLALVTRLYCDITETLTPEWSLVGHWPKPLDVWNLTKCVKNYANTTYTLKGNTNTIEVTVIHKINFKLINFSPSKAYLYLVTVIIEQRKNRQLRLQTGTIWLCYFILKKNWQQNKSTFYIKLLVGLINI